MMKFRLLLMIAALFFPGPPESVSPGEETFEAFRDRQMRALRDPKTTRETRLQALEWVGKNARSVDNAEATTAVEKCLRDPDAKVRAAAIEPRASLAIAAKMTCPPSVLGAM